MCVATPGRVVEIDGNTAKVDFSGNLVRVNISLVEASVGDYVLTHAGMAIEKLDPEKAEELIKLFEEIAGYADDGR
jgi:hydrogenase expression/formation protein HypC